MSGRGLARAVALLALAASAGCASAYERRIEALAPRARAALREMRGGESAAPVLVLDRVDYLSRAAGRDMSGSHAAALEDGRYSREESAVLLVEPDPRRPAQSFSDAALTAFLVHELTHARQHERGARAGWPGAGEDAVDAGASAAEGEAMLTQLLWQLRCTTRTALATAGVDLGAARAAAGDLRAVAASVWGADIVRAPVEAHRWALGLACAVEVYLAGGWPAVEAWADAPPASTAALIAGRRDLAVPAADVSLSTLRDRYRGPALRRATGIRALHLLARLPPGPRAALDALRAADGAAVEVARSTEEEGPAFVALLAPDDPRAARAATLLGGAGARRRGRVVVVQVEGPPAPEEAERLLAALAAE